MTASLEEARRFLSLASDDLAAFRALASTPNIRPAIAIFHAQQSVEKSLKAILFAEGVEFRRTHDLYELADRVEQASIALPCSAEELGLLNSYAVHCAVAWSAEPSFRMRVTLVHSSASAILALLLFCTPAISLKNEILSATACKWVTASKPRW